MRLTAVAAVAIGVLVVALLARGHWFYAAELLLAFGPMLALQLSMRRRSNVGRRNQTDVASALRRVAIGVPVVLALLNLLAVAFVWIFVLNRGRADSIAHLDKFGRGLDVLWFWCGNWVFVALIAVIPALGAWSAIRGERRRNQAAARERQLADWVKEAIGVVIMAGIPLALAVYLGIRLWNLETDINRLAVGQPKFESLLREVHPTSRSGFALDAPALRYVGPILIVERERGQSSVKLANPRFIRRYDLPQGPADIRAVVIVTRIPLSARQYNYGQDFQWNFDVDVITWPEERNIAHASFVGARPNNRSGSPAGAGNDTYGSEPWDQVSDWLQPLLAAEGR